MAAMTTKADQEAERRKVMEKLFNLAENPLKEWLALAIGVDPKELFDTYSSEADTIIGRDDGKKSWIFYLTTGEENRVDGALPDKLFEASPEVVEKNQELARCASMLFDSVAQIFVAVVSSASAEHQETLGCVMPKFDESHMRFELSRVNTRGVRRAQINKKLKEVAVQKARLMEIPDGAERDGVKKADIVAQLDDFRKKSIEELEGITDEGIAEEQALCEEFDEKHKNGPFLYFYASTEISMDEQFTKLPDMGGSFVDPDEAEDLNFDDLEK